MILHLYSLQTFINIQNRQCHHSQNQNLNFWLILTLGKSKHSFTEKVTVWLCHCVTWILLLQNVKLFRFTATTTLKCILYVDMWIFLSKKCFLRCFSKNVTVWHAQSWCPGMNGLGGGPDSFLWSLVHILNRFLKISLQLTRCKI